MNIAREPKVVLLACALSVMSASSVAGERLMLRAGFPNPTVIGGLVTDMQVSLSETPWGKCGEASSMTSREPLLSFDLAEEQRNLELRVDIPGGSITMDHVVVFPDHRYFCGTKGAVYFDRWPAGSYRVYLVMAYGQAQVSVRIEDVPRTKQTAASALGKLTPVEISARMPENPKFIDTSTGPAIMAAEAGVEGCITPRQYVAPVARLQVTEAMERVSLSLGKTPLIVAPAAGACVLGDDDLSTGGKQAAVPLAAGGYTVYALSTRDAPPQRVSLEIDDPSRGMAFSPVGPKTSIGELAEPLLLSGKTRAAQTGPHRDDHGCPRPSPRAPDLWLTASTPVQGVELRRLWSPKKQWLKVYGPLERSEANALSRCDTSDPEQPLVVDLFEGTYAVWVGGERSAVGSDFHLAITGPKTRRDPFAMPVRPDAGLSVLERAIDHHYPFLHVSGQQEPRGVPLRLFTTAPDELFVYARMDIAADSEKKPPIQGEPLLVLQGNEDRTWVLTHEGEQFHVPTRALATTRPATVRFLEQPRAVEAGDLEAAIRLSGVEDEKEIARYEAALEKFLDCRGHYVEQHDPTARKAGVNLYKVTYRGTKVSKVENYSESIVNQGARQCGGDRVDKMGDALKKKLDAGRERRRQSALAEVRRRFGV